MNKRLPKNHYALIIDVETHMRSENQNVIYDIAGAFGNIRSHEQPIYFNWFIEEHIAPSFWNWSYMEENVRNPYRFDGRADAVYHYTRKNPCSIISVDDFFHKLNPYLEQAESIGAYNAGFDFRALQTTHMKYNHTPYKVLTNCMDKGLCIWDMFATLTVNKTYYSWLESEGIPIEEYMTAKGNIKTSAEIAGKYLFGDHYYSEAHQGLKDVQLEWEIAKYHFDKFPREIFYGIALDTDEGYLTKPFIGNIHVPNYRHTQSRKPTTWKLKNRGLIKIPE